MIRSWSITVLITFLTIFWAAILVPIAGAINPSTIKKVFPSFGGMLESNPNINSLVTTQAPTLLSALLFVGVPYLYDCKLIDLPLEDSRSHFTCRARQQARHDVSL